ncbi:MAG: TIGR02597 family protein, partial [Limisphaerales bacterium]
LAGGTVAVPVVVTNAAGLASAAVTINYDLQVLAFDSVTSGNLAQNYSMQYSSTAEGTIKIAAVLSTAAPSGNGTLAILHFHGNSGAVPGLLSLVTLADRTLGGQYGRDLAWSQTISHVDGSVTVVSSTQDSNNNGYPDWYEEANFGGPTNMTVVIFPTISQHPASQTINIGGNAIFSVTAGGTSPSYQWRFNGVTIESATLSSYTRSNAQLADAGSYSVVVSNAAGSVTSSSATLTVKPCVIKLLNPVVNADSSIALTWGLDAGTSVNFEYKNSLLDAQWTSIGSFVASSTTLVISNAPPTNSQRFYHLTAPCGTSDVAGVIPLSLLGNSDSFVSIPFARTSAARGSIAAIASNVVSVISDDGSVWSPNQFVYVGGTQTNNYYLRLTSGTAEGKSFPITGNDATSVNLDLGSDRLSGVTVNDSVVIEPYWTLDSVFPAGRGVNISPTLGNRNTEVLIPDLANVGINLSSAKIYFFHVGIWKQVGQGSVDHGSDILQPNTYFLVRHNVATNTTLMSSGVVIPSKLVTRLSTSPITKRDNYVGLMRPITNSLAASGLINTGAFAASPLPGSRTDELLVFDNSVVQKNKSSSAVYYYWNNAWRRVGSGSADVGSVPVLTPGMGFIIRKATNAASIDWTNQKNW